MNHLIKQLIEHGYLKSDAVINAFDKIDRFEFVPENLASHAEMNIPLPIGHGQTISQPLTVAFMLELLDIQSGQNILDIGSGSGWTTSLLANIAGEGGHITALDVIPELVEIGQRNAEKYNFVSKGIAEFHLADGHQGYAPNAPYDRILVSASSDETPQALKEQLKIGGKMVIPIMNAIWYLEKKGEDDFEREVYKGFSFVPLVHESN